MLTLAKLLVVAGPLVASAIVGDSVAVAAQGTSSRPVPPYITCPASTSTVPAAAASSSPDDAISTRGVVEVAVPRLTFVSVVGARLVVTTNTQAPPDPTDTFYVVTGRRARVATPAMRAGVLRACR